MTAMSTDTMNNAPAVYVPTQPEGNGLTLPTILSILAHSIVFALLIYTYEQPELDMSNAIETTMVSPAELAEMQGQIMANRAASAQAASSSSELSTEPFNPATSNSTNQNSAQSSSQRVPVFTRSEDSNQNDYATEMEIFREEMRDGANERLQAPRDAEMQRQNDEQQELAALKDIESTPQPSVKKPNKTQGNIEIESGSSDRVSEVFNLADGQSTAGSSTASISSSKSSGGGSRGASNGEIASLIKRYYSPPAGAKGSTQFATLTITVNSNGDVLSVSASGSNEEVNRAAEKAVRKVGNLPVSAETAREGLVIRFNGSN